MGQFVTVLEHRNEQSSKVYPATRARPQRANFSPPYLHRRDRSFYFKRKIPVDCVDAFPGLHGQVWKSLETTLFERARVMLAVEVTEFDMLVARHQNERATRLASVTPLCRAATV